MAELSRKDQMDIEAYRSLDNWARAATNHMYIVARWSIFVPVATLAYVWQPTAPPASRQIGALVIGLVIMAVLIFMALKGYPQITFRYRLMRDIEGRLHFRAHNALREFSDKQGYRAWNSYMLQAAPIALALFLLANLIWIVLQC